MIYNILIVEDNVISAIHLQELLLEAGYNIIGIARKGTDAITMAKERKPDLILTDILLGDNISGCDAAIQINQNNSDIAIIFLTAYAEDEMIALATYSNASAYLMKPYRDAEILATIQVILARKEKLLPSSKQAQIIKLKNNFYFDTQTMILTQGKKQIPLTATKRKLITILAKNLNKTISNEHICHFIWGEHKDTSTLRSLVYRTKQTIGEDLITNINGVGYCISSK